MKCFDLVNKERGILYRYIVCIKILFKIFDVLYN